MTRCLFCHFDILVFEFHAILTKWNISYIKKYLVCCVLTVREHSFFFFFFFSFFLFLANVVDCASAYFTFILIFFSNERANPKTKEWIWCGLTNTTQYYILHKTFTITVCQTPPVEQLRNIMIY